MKVTFDVECTPDEARRFLGLPDVAPMQEALMKELEKQMRDNMRSLDPETMLKTWLPATMQGWGEVQKMFWNQMSTMGTSTANAAQSQATRDAADKAEKSADKDKKK